MGPEKQVQSTRFLLSFFHTEGLAPPGHPPAVLSITGTLGNTGKTQTR